MEIEELISCCDKMYRGACTDHGYKDCKDCTNDCYGSCKRCLEYIHFENNRRYNCINMLNYYVCKYSYRYLSEIGRIFSEINILDSKKDISMISIGCGPCTDLFGVKQYMRNNNVDINLKYTGIELEDKWQYVHKLISSKTGNNDIKFIYTDITKDDDLPNELNTCDILFFQYVISDMTRNNTEQDMKTFLQHIVERIIWRMKAGSYIIINDINHDKARVYFDKMVDIMGKVGIKSSAWRYHFESNKPTHYHYGNEYEDNSLICYVDDDIKRYYGSWMNCGSAQIIIRRE